MNASKIAQNVLANSTLFNFNDSNPIFKFATGIRIGNLTANQTDTSGIAPSLLGSLGAAPSGPILEPIFQPLLSSVINGLFNSLSPIASLAGGSPLPALLTNATDNGLRAVDDGLVSFLENVTSVMVQDTWQDFAGFLQGGGSSASSSAPGMTSTLSSVASTTTAAAKLADRQIMEHLDDRQISLPDPFSIGPALSSVASGLFPGASATGSATGSAASATSTSDGGLLGGLIGGLGGAIPDSVESAFAPVLYNFLKTAVAALANSALSEVERVLNANSTDPDAQALQNITSSFSTEIRSLVNADLNSLANTSAKSFGVPDFYSAHLSRYCYGNYVPAQSLSPGQNLSDVTDWKKVITGCAHVSSWKTFEINKPLQRRLNETGSAIILPPVYLPNGIRNNLGLIEALTTAIFAVQVVGVVFAFLAFPIFALVILWRGTDSLLTNLIEVSSITVVATAAGSLLLVSILVTAVILIARGTISQLGKVVSLDMTTGTVWLALSWIASVFACIAAALWGLYIFIRRKRRARDEINDIPSEKARLVQAVEPIAPAAAVTRRPVASQQGSDPHRVSSHRSGMDSSSSEVGRGSMQDETDGSAVAVARSGPQRQISDPRRSSARRSSTLRPASMRAVRGSGIASPSEASPTWQLDRTLRRHSRTVPE